MLPGFPSHDQTDSGVVDPMFPSKSALTDSSSGMAITNLLDLVSCQFAQPTAILHHHIGHVVRLGAQEEMFDRHAARDVAGMKNTQTIRDRTVLEFPCDTVGQEVLALRLTFCPHASIAHVIERSGPEDTPSFVGRTDVPQESFLQWSIEPAVANSGAESPLGSAGTDKERRLANLAGASDSGRLAWHDGPPRKVRSAEWPGSLKLPGHSYPTR